MINFLKLFVTLCLAQSALATPGLLEVLKSLKLTTFIDGLKNCGIDRTINHEGHFTIFAPTNDAFANEKWYPGNHDFCSKISFHIAKGYLKIEELQDEQVVKALLGKRTIRINIYPFKNNLKTANGRTIIDTDHLARNGVVHVLSEVMSSVYKREGSVVSEIEECCPEHSDLLELLKLSGMYSKLDRDGPFTLLAPNNGAFAKLHPDFIIHLKKNLTAMVNLLSGHVIPLTYYSSGLPDTLEVQTLYGNNITVKNNGGVVTFGKATVTLADVTAYNGVVHAIDEVLFAPPQFHSTKHPRRSIFKNPSKNLVELMKQLGFDSFSAAMKLTGVDKLLRHEGPFTIFAPSNDAFNHPDNYPKNFRLSDRVKYHIARGVIRPSTIKNDDQATTLLSNRTIKFNVFERKGDKTNPRMLITANGREIRNGVHEAFNGIICTMVSSAMDYVYSANGTLENEIEQYPEFSIFSMLVKNHLGNILGHKNGFDMTVFVPTNSVLEKALKYSSPQDVANHLLMNHFVPKTWYTIGMEQYGVIKSLGGKELTIKGSETVYTINHLQLEMIDFTTCNGVFHQINGLL